MTVWLWDAPGPVISSRGVSRDLASAQRAACACLASGQAASAVVQEAELVAASALSPYYRPAGLPWLASRSWNGTIRWHPRAVPAAS